MSSLWHLRLPFYYRPFKLHGIEVRYRLAFSFPKLPARLWHEVYWERYVPTARWLAYAEVLSLPGPMLERRRGPGRAGERA